MVLWLSSGQESVSRGNVQYLEHALKGKARASCSSPSCWWKGSHRGEPSVSPNKGAVLEATEQHAGSSLDPKGSAESSLQFLNWEKNKPFFTEHLETFSIVVKIHVINNIYLSHFKVCGLIMLSIFASLYNQSPENLSCKAKTILTEPELLFALTPGSNHGV